MSTALSRVMPVADFYEDTKKAWDSLFVEAEIGMVEPLRVGTELCFCRVLDPWDMPMDSCSLEAAKFAVCTVRVKDLGTEEEPDWEPLCTSRGRRVLA